MIDSIPRSPAAPPAPRVRQPIRAAGTPSGDAASTQGRVRGGISPARRRSRDRLSDAALVSRWVADLTAR